MVIYGASDGGIPFLVKFALDKVLEADNVSYLYTFPIILILISLVRGFADFGQQYLSAKIGHFVVRDIRNDLNQKLLKLGGDYYLNHPSGDLLARMTGDVLLIKNLLTESLASIIRDVIRVVALAITAIYLDPVLSLIALVVMPVGVTPVVKFGKKIRKLSRIGQDGIGSLGSQLEETINGQKLVKLFNAEGFEIERFSQENNKLTNTLIKSEKIRAFTGPINEVLASLAISGIILYGGFSVMSKARTKGEFIAFLMAVFLLYDPLKKLSKINSSVQQGIAASQRVFEVLDVSLTVFPPINPITIGKNSDVEFKDVTFSYTNKNHEALKNINLVIKEGQKIALVGFSGSGKSTLVDLIPRFIDPTSGVVTVGGIDVKKVDLFALRERVTMVSQHTFLFNDSVYNNIAYANRKASKQDILKACSDAYATDFIEMLPNGIDTVIGQSGYSLSGGERQRIAIARAMLKNSPILILDEATAALDNQAERMVQLALERLESNRTTLVIAHRLSTVQSADQIIVLKSGVIVESGKHSELLLAGGEYSHLHSFN
jgi:ATP-binding cassette, subfamily B, bacterial MsbA